MIRIILAVIYLLFVFSGCAHTVSKPTIEKDGDLYEEILPNGLKVFALRDPNSPLAVSTL